MSNSMYLDNVRNASIILRDAPQNARNISAYWIEHVIKFGGQHLRPHALDMLWYQYLMLDIILFIGLVIILVVFCIKRTLTLIYRQLSGANINKLKIN